MREEKINGRTVGHNDSLEDYQYFGESYYDETDGSMSAISENEDDTSGMDASNPAQLDSQELAKLDDPSLNEFGEDQNQSMDMPAGNNAQSMYGASNKVMFESRYQHYIVQSKAVQQPPSFIYEII